MTVKCSLYKSGLLVLLFAIALWIIALLGVEVDSCIYYVVVHAFVSGSANVVVIVFAPPCVSASLSFSNRVFPHALV
jgi:hypothetical protein